MPRYFFHLHHRWFRPGEEGVEVASDAQAWTQGTQACGQMIRDLDGRLDNGPEYRMECVDETGRKVFTLHFAAETFFT